MIGHPKRHLRNITRRVMEIFRMFKYACIPFSYKISWKHGCLYSIAGKNNVLKIDSWCDGNLLILVRGNNNTITISKNVHFGPRCAFSVEGNNIQLHIGDYCTFTHNVHLACDDQTKLIIEDDCMFSHDIIVRTSDSHTIFDIATKEKLNFPQDVYVKQHVWVGPNSTIAKGCIIGKNSVIASNSVVTHSVPENVIVAGAPAKIRKEHISWSRSSNSSEQMLSTVYRPDIATDLFNVYMS